MKILLDANAYTALAAGDAGVRRLAGRASIVLMSVAVIVELRYGFMHGRRTQVNEAALEDFLGRSFVEMLPATAVTADRYARIATALRRKGRPIPHNDIWIAAHALEHGAELLSFDGDFRNVGGLVTTVLSGR